MTALLKVEGLKVSYGPVAVLRGLDVSIERGDIRALLGANGAGKSTFIKAILGLVAIEEGSLLFDGAELRRLGTNAIHRLGIAWAPQGRQTFSTLTVRQNLAIGAYSERDRHKVDERFAYVHDMFPVLAQRSSQLAGSLSGGEQQVLSIARALMSGPKLLLMDEPSIGLSPRAIDVVFEMMFRVRERGVSILIVEQNARQALAVADWAYVLEAGRVVASASAKDLQNDDAIRRAYLGR
jgi:branched-chain amino acid transport system ATP-binding protein